MLIQWQEAGQKFTANWFSSHQAKPPKAILAVGDDLSASKAYKQASEGMGLLWRGDYQNARQLLSALVRRVSQSQKPDKSVLQASPEGPLPTAQLFHQHRHQQAQVANIVHKLLVCIEADHSLRLRRATVLNSALQAFCQSQSVVAPFVLSLKDLLGIIGSYEWSIKGVEIPALGMPPKNRIFASYGVFSPVRGEYIDLVANTSLPNAEQGKGLVAFDVGTGTGVLAAVLAKRGVSQVVATDSSHQAVACAKKNIDQLGLSQQVTTEQKSFFPSGQADLVVCNPPWLPAKPKSLLETAIYDPNNQMLKGFLKEVGHHLKPQGRVWLILSDIAEHLQLRSRQWLLDEMKQNGLEVESKQECNAKHPKVFRASDPLHWARSQETTTLWVLKAANC